MRNINIGFGNIVVGNKIKAVKNPKPQPIKRLVQAAREEGRLIDATYGRRVRAVIITETHIITSSVGADTIQQRVNGE